ncbi:MAG: ATP synthase F0 subunit B [Desulfobacterium sp.]|nr:ATP synthase F0 subunit B [Desulfobacterium sp.]
MKIARRLGYRFPAILSATALFLLTVAGVALASSGGGAEAAPKGWVIEDTYKVMNFVVLAAALFFIAKKPVKEFFSSRTTGIQEELEGLELKKAEAEKVLAGYAEKISALDQEAERIVADYVAQGEDAKKRILAEAEAQATKLEEMAKRNIEQEFKSAKDQLRQEISEKALAQAEVLVKKSIATEDQDRLVDDYLTKVVA